MRASTTPAPKSLAVLMLASAVALGCAAPASAEKRAAAPIIFVGQGQAQPARAYAKQPAPITSSDKAGRRIEFRYPDQPQVFHGVDGPRSAQSAAPIAFSSAKTAITPAKARQYASAQAPAMTSPAIIADPSISAGGFDARAAAARIEASRVSHVVDSAPLAALPGSAPGLTGQGAAPMMGQTPAASYTVVNEPTPVFDETAASIVYGDEFDGLPTANGEIFSQSGMTAAHPSLPLPSLVQVVHLGTGREIVVRVNDRGPFEDGAGFQLSRRAADVLGFDGAGRAEVRMRYLGAAPVEADTLADAPQMVSTPAGLEGYTVQTTAPQPILQAPAVPVYDRPATETAIYQPVSYNQTSGEYFVQLGSFADISNAQSLQASLSGGMPTVIQQARVNGADYFRVRVGPLDNRDTASSLRDHLAAQGFAQGRVVTGD